jgi:hypothetical protein
MNAICIQPRHLLVALIATPFVAFGAYVAWLVVPVVIREVVPEVIRAVINT